MTKKLNSFKANVLFIYPLKMPENLWFSDVFRGYRNGTLAQKKVNDAMMTRSRLRNKYLKEKSADSKIASNKERT